jgi:hypothetical protein
MSLANRLWGAPRIHGELLKLGIEVAQSTVAKYMARSGRGRSQTWKTFLHNHAAGIGAMDFLVVPTAGFRLLFVLVILRHERRRLISLSVTAHPTAEWIAHQIPAIAEAEPAVFLESLWPWYADLFAQIIARADRDEVAYVYPGQYVLELDFLESTSGSAGREKPVTSSVQLAIEGLAEVDPDAFPRRLVLLRPHRVLRCGNRITLRNPRESQNEIARFWRFGPPNLAIQNLLLPQKTD